MTIQMPTIHSNTLWSGWTGIPKPQGVIIHNDYGAMSALQYENWLKGRANTPEKGFAHYYIDRFTIGRYVSTLRAAYHAGDGSGVGNRWYIGYEVVESYDENYVKVSDAEFIENENMTLRQAAEDLLYWGLPANRTTVKLHQQFASTSCPHRSWKLHGRSVHSVQGYFIERIKYYMSLGKTVQEMINAENKKGEVKPKMAEKEVYLQNYRKANVYEKPSFDSKYVNTKAKDSSIRVSHYEYGQADKEGNNVWVLVDKGTKFEGYIHDNNFLSIRRDEVYQQKK